ncbi:hypothetical protein [Emticicia soli]|uniref:DUF1566 domain-containing protein n=1 Tax=Emticicia soli TaxID=2027878 RepID=A0ABW5JB34_9BACT
MKINLLLAVTILSAFFVNVAFCQNVTITPDGITPQSDSGIHSVGEHYGGGIIFYVYDNGRHGLIAATSDITNVSSGNGVTRITNARGNGIGAGMMNTMLLIAMQTNDNSSGTFAAKSCAEYNVTVDGVTYGDWYMPSLHELRLLYDKSFIVGGFLYHYTIYLSSTEGSIDWQFGYWFADEGNRDSHLEIFSKTQTGRTRPIRRF